MAEEKRKKRLKGDVVLKKEEVEMEVGMIFSYITHGKKKITHPKNIEAGLLPDKPLTIKQACLEKWISYQTYYNHMKAFPDIKQKYELLRETRREYMKDVAEENILSVLDSDDLSAKDKFDANFKLLQATEKSYNPKMEIETRNLNVNISKSSDDLKKDIWDLLSKYTT